MECVGVAVVAMAILGDPGIVGILIVFETLGAWLKNVFCGNE
jgi:hypothetical protein